METPQHQYLDAAEVAAMLAVSEETVRHRSALGGLPPPHYLGAGHLRWRRDEIDTWLHTG